MKYMESYLNQRMLNLAAGAWKPLMCTAHGRMMSHRCGQDGELACVQCLTSGGQHGMHWRPEPTPVWFCSFDFMDSFRHVSEEKLLQLAGSTPARRPPAAQNVENAEAVKEKVTNQGGNDDVKKSSDQNLSLTFKKQVRFAEEALQEKPVSGREKKLGSSSSEDEPGNDSGINLDLNGNQEKAIPAATASQSDNCCSPPVKDLLLPMKVEKETKASANRDVVIKKQRVHTTSLPSSQLPPTSRGRMTLIPDCHLICAHRPAEWTSAFCW
jgi:hypothetical protein